MWFAESGVGSQVFRKIWNNPGEPNWTKENSQFPLGTCVFKVCGRTSGDGL
jgi:hypothetical protein